MGKKTPEKYTAWEINSLNNTVFQKMITKSVRVATSIKLCNLNKNYLLLSICLFLVCTTPPHTHTFKLYHNCFFFITAWETYYSYWQILSFSLDTAHKTSRSQQRYFRLFWSQKIDLRVLIYINVYSLFVFKAHKIQASKSGITKKTQR